MILVLDNCALTLMVNPEAKPPSDPETGGELESVKERIEGLIASLSSADTLIVPTPVLAEVLVGAGEAAPELLAKIQTLARLRIVPFDARAAIETAMMENEARASGSKKGVSEAPWQKVKFDRQIIAIARVGSADAIYSDDGNLIKFAKSLGMTVQSTWDLPVPEKTRDLFTELNQPRPLNLG